MLCFDGINLVYSDICLNLGIVVDSWVYLVLIEYNWGTRSTEVASFGIL